MNRELGPASVGVQEKMNTSTDVLTDILSAVAVENGEIEWPPRDPKKTASLREVTDCL